MTSPNDVEAVHLVFNVDVRRLREAGIDLTSETKQRVVQLMLDALQFYVDCRPEGLEGEDLETERAIKDAFCWLPEG